MKCFLPGVEIHFEKPPLFDGLNGYIVHRGSPDGEYSIVESIQFSPSDPMTTPNPSLHISDNEAQRMMNQLWNIGIRPSEIGSPGQIASMKEHIKDLRFVIENLFKPKP